MARARVARELGVEVVGEERGVQEALGGKRDRVLVDRAGEQRDLHRAEEHVGAFGAVPHHPVADLGPGALVVRARGVEVGDLHRQIGHADHAHAGTLPTRVRAAPAVGAPIPSSDDQHLAPADGVTRHVGGAPGVHPARAALRPVLRRRGRAGAATLLHHGISHGDVGSSVVSYVLVFFAIWWAWMNFTWFASAYDNDDVVYRLLVLVQIAGVLILAAAYRSAFEHRDFDIVFVGYIVMRVALVTLWLRAGHHDPPRRGATHRFAVGESVCMVGWAGVALLGWPVWAFVGHGHRRAPRARVGRAAAHTTWHPEHIAERYGLFTIIVLGETILASSIAFQVVVDDRSGDLSVAARRPSGALLTVFSMWWIYFAKPAAPRLRVEPGAAFPWGYGHYVVFAAAAAVGAGVGVMVDHVTDRAHISDVGAAASFTVPVVLYVLAVAFIQTLLSGVHRDRLGGVVVAVVLVAAATLTGQPVLLTGLVLSVLVAFLLVRQERASP